MRFSCIVCLSLFVIACSRTPTARGPVTDETIAALAKSPPAIARGKRLFATKCAPCHGRSGEGGLGPNLSDRFWLHGGEPLAIYRSIHDGAVSRGMQPWGRHLDAEAVAALAAYVLTLRDTNPPRATAPEGVEQR
jgi:cytochrome c oxidase cbb3-type subunit 3